MGRYADVVAGFSRGWTVLGVGVALAVLTGCSTTGAGGPTRPATTSATTSATRPTSATVAHALRLRPVLAEVAAVGPGSASGANACWNVSPAQAADVPRVGSAGRAALVTRCRTLRQSTDPTAQATALNQLNCGFGFLDVLAGNDDPQLPLVTCDQPGRAKYSLGATFLDGSDVTGATVRPATDGSGYVVALTFDATGTRIWAAFTSAHIGSQAAFVLDGAVLSAPTIESGITSGSTEITGDFTHAQAQQLATTLAGG